MPTLSDSLTPTLVLDQGEFAVKSLAFSPDGRWLATADDRSTRLWELANPTAMTTIVLHGHEAAVSALAFSPDGRWLATASDDTTVRLWHTWVSDLIDLACSAAGRNFTVQEWQRYLGDMPYRGTCSQWEPDPASARLPRDSARQSRISSPAP